MFFYHCEQNSTIVLEAFPAFPAFPVSLFSRTTESTARTRSAGRSNDGTELQGPLGGGGRPECIFNQGGSQKPWQELYSTTSVIQTIPE